MRDIFLVPIYQDSIGIIWVGSGGGGCNYFYPDKKYFHLQRHNPNLENTICSNNISAIFEDRDGVTWVGSRTNGLNIIELEENGQFIKNIEHIDANANSTKRINKVYN